MIPEWVVDKGARSSLKSDMRVHHVCVITCSNRVVSIGVNQNGTNRFAKRHGYEWSLHAEAMAIQGIGRKAHKANKYKLYVMRFSKDGRLMPSEPCQNCKRLIEKAGIRKVFWS